jgi:plastocyanin
VAVTPGTYKVICSLFAGTPESHEAKGMRATLTVR